MLLVACYCVLECRLLSPLGCRTVQAPCVHPCAIVYSSARRLPASCVFRCTAVVAPLTGWMAKSMRPISSARKLEASSHKRSQPLARQTHDKACPLVASCVRALVSHLDFPPPWIGCNLEENVNVLNELRAFRSVRRPDRASDYRSFGSSLVEGEVQRRPSLLMKFQA